MESTSNGRNRPAQIEGDRASSRGPFPTSEIGNRTAGSTCLLVSCLLLGGLQSFCRTRQLSIRPFLRGRQLASLHLRFSGWVRTDRTTIPEIGGILRAGIPREVRFALEIAGLGEIPQNRKTTPKHAPKIPRGHRRRSSSTDRSDCPRRSLGRELVACLTTFLPSFFIAA